MELTTENHKKYAKMSKKDLVTEIIGICIHLIMSKNLIDNWLNKKQVIMELYRAIREDYTKKYEKWELELIIFNENRIIGDIEYILDKKVCKKIHKSTYTDDEVHWITPRDEVSPESPSDDLSPSEQFPLPILRQLKILSDPHFMKKQKKNNI